MNNLERPVTKAYNIASPEWYAFKLREVLREAKDKGTDSLTAILDKVQHAELDLFAGAETEFNALIAQLSAQAYANDSELIEAFAKGISEFAQSHFSLAELERRARRPERPRKDRVVLNEILFFNLGRNDPTKIKLHISPASTLSIKEKLSQFRGGLQKLAKLLREDPELAEVTSIVARSWIVLKNPGIFERAGFIIAPEDDKDRIHEARKATISREDFLRRYGQVI